MKTLSGNELSKIGIGSYGVGGRGHRDMILTEQLEDEAYIDALAYHLEKGMNFTEIALGYGHGKSLDLFKESLDRTSIKREDIFLTHSLYPRDLVSLDTFDQDVKSFYEVMQTEYADSTLVTQSLIMKFGTEEVYRRLHALLNGNKTRYVSLSNANPEYIKAFKKEFGSLFFAHEGHLSFEVRALQDKGVLSLVEELNVQNIIWRPLRRNNTTKQNWPLLVELASKYQKTQNQIVLNWMCRLGYRPMVMSATKSHVDENIAATEFEMDEQDILRLTEFRPPHYSPPSVDWEGIGIDDSIVTLVNEFEKHVSS